MEDFRVSNSAGRSSILGEKIGETRTVRAACGRPKGEKDGSARLSIHLFDEEFASSPNHLAVEIADECMRARCFPCDIQRRILATLRWVEYRKGGSR